MSTLGARRLIAGIAVLGLIAVLAGVLAPDTWWHGVLGMIGVAS